jgi:hypothetical protein
MLRTIANGLMLGRRRFCYEQRYMEMGKCILNDGKIGVANLSIRADMRYSLSTLTLSSVQYLRHLTSSSCQTFVYNPLKCSGKDCNSWTGSAPSSS